MEIIRFVHMCYNTIKSGKVKKGLKINNFFSWNES